MKARAYAMTQYNPFALPLLLTVIPLIWIIGRIWRHRADFTARMFILYAITACTLVMSYAFELFSADLNWIKFWLRWEYLSHWGTLFWLLFALGYAGYGHLVTRRRIIALFIIPVISQVLVWTNDAHGLIWSRTGTQIVDGLVMFDRDYGPLFWVWIGYIYSAVALGTLLLIWRALHEDRVYRDQIVLLLIAVTLPWAGSISTVLDWVPFPLLDLSPYGVALSCLPIYLVFRRYRFFELVPAAIDMVVEQMPDGMIVCDPNGRILKLNPAAGAVLPPQPPLLGRLLTDILPDLGPFAPASGSRQIRLGGSTHEARSFPLYGARKRLTGYVVILQDITVRLQAEQHALELVAERERAGALETMVQDVAHDMRTPLSVIVMNLNVIEKLVSDPALPPALADKFRRRVNTMVDYEQRLRQVLASMSEVLQASSAPPVPFTSQDFNRVVQEQVEDHRLWAQEKDITLDLTLAGAPLPVDMDEPHLRRALDKVIENALIYTPAGGRVDVRTAAQDGLALCEVRDTGIGISEQDVPRVFEDFFRADRARPVTGGTGLGLSIAQRIIERHRGAIRVSSLVDVGSTFCIELPLLRS